MGWGGSIDEKNYPQETFGNEASVSARSSQAEGWP